MTLNKSHVVRKLAIMSLVIVYLFLASAVVIGQEQNSVRIVPNQKNLQLTPQKPANQVGRIIILDNSAKKQQQQRQGNQPARSETEKKQTPVKNQLPVQNQPPVIKKIDMSLLRNIPAQQNTLTDKPVAENSQKSQNQLLDRMVNKSTVAASQQRAQQTQNSQVRQIADLPRVKDSDTADTNVNTTAFYPATQNQNPIVVAGGQPVTSQPVTQPNHQESKPATEKPADGKFTNRGEYNMLRPVMPRPVNVPGNNQERRIDPRREQILSSGEYLHDGGDRNLKTVVGGDWSVKGLDTEDTIGHYDTLGGDRIVVPSNRVSIYAPRFAAVRQVDGLISADGIERTAKASDTRMTFRSNGSDFATTTKQHVAAEKNVASKSASALIDRTKGIVVENTTITKTIGNQISPTKIHNFVLTGYMSNAEKPFIAAAIQAAKKWSNTVEVQAVVKNEKIEMVHDVKSANDVTHVDPKGKKSKLRVIKMASKRSAQTGETIEFTIRFDNIGSELIGNVTIIDNLTARLEYIEGSASCNVKADLITKQNDAGSATLRWEIIEPMKIGTGGVIRFKCRVR